MLFFWYVNDFVMKKRKSNFTFATQITISISLRRRGTKTWRATFPLLLCFPDCQSAVLPHTLSVTISTMVLLFSWIFKAINLTPDSLNFRKLYSFAMCKFSVKPFLRSLRHQYYWGKILKIRSQKHFFPFMLYCS